MEDTFNGALSAMMFYNGYINTVAEELGMDRALSLTTKMCETMGVMQGQMMKEQAGDKEMDPKAAWELIKTVPESLGISMEVIEESPQMIVTKVGKCPIYTAAQMLGMDGKAIENLCRSGAARFMDTVTKQLNPNLSHQLRKFRSSPDDFCEEAVVLG